MKFELAIETESYQIVRLRLLDQRGVQLAASQVELGKHTAKWEGLFDTRTYVKRYTVTSHKGSSTKPKTEDDILEEIGLFLGETVLGPGIMNRLAGSQHRTLLVHLPSTSHDPLVAALARVPWEIARNRVENRSLQQRNLVVCTVTDDSAQLESYNDSYNPLRILLVFAESPGSRPLAMRLEREFLSRLFYDQVLPQRRVEFDVLCHGVTRKRLREQIITAGGYQIIHWSGHGHHNQLELHSDNGCPDHLSGEDLVQLIYDAGGFIPQFIFLNACLSGAFINLHNWAELHAAMTDNAVDGTKISDSLLPGLLPDKAGYTGIAMELLKAGVPQVVAMRYEVGDNYALDLAEGFYKHLLTDKIPHSVETALSLTRNEMVQGAGRLSGYHAVDHITPLVFGGGNITFYPVAGRSDQLGYRRPHPQPLLPGNNHELDRPEIFVGRGTEITRIARYWLPRDQQAVVLIQGLAGLGKTVLAAELINLWHRRFDLVFAFQAKSFPLTPEDFYRQFDLKLRLHSAAYQNSCTYRPSRVVYLPTSSPLTGEERFSLMRTNLIEALRDQDILLVFDNFETNLETVAGATGYHCQDPEWDHLLVTLTEQLPPTGSRVIVTSRHRLAALTDTRKSLWIDIGPLPMNEAALYLRNHDALCRLYHRDAAGQALARRLLEISRGHPLILDRLATLANDPAALAQTLDSLQDGSGWQNLSDIFAAKSETDRADERVYLEDITIGAIDLLIQRTSSNARRLLWMIALADEPVSLALIEAFWAGESVELEDVEKMRNSLAEILPEDQRKKFEDLLATEGGQHHLKPLYEMFFPAVPPVRPLLDELHGAGLLSREEESSYTSHELVRERIVRWMEDHPDDTAGHSQKEVWYAYGHRYAMTCEQLQTSRQDGAMEKATEAGRRALIYLARASAIDLFAAIGSSMITNTQNPAALQSAIKEIRAIIEQVPPGKSHWLILLNLADALCNIDQLDEALPLYEQAAKEAEGDEDWKDLAVICHNWAGGLRNSGDLCQAKTTFLRGAEVAKKAGMPRIHILFDELSALRIYVTQGEVATSMPEIEWRLDEVRSLWQQYIAGERASEAIDPVILARTFSSALETAGYANKISENWERCLSLLLEAEQLGRDLGKGGVELAQTRFNQFPSLLKLGRLDEAQLVVESCLDEFITKQHTQGQVMALGALAHIWRERGEISKAIDLSRQVLLLYNSYSDPIDRARSHCNLAWYLGETGNLHEAARHQLADIIYCHVSGHRQSLMSAIANLIEFNTRATQAGHRYKLPRLADLLADPEFNALKQFLTSRNIDFDDLQASIDAYN